MKKYGLIMVCLLFISTIGFVPQVAGDGESWLMGWDYRRTVDITGSAGAGTNYQVSFTVTELDEMQADFGGIRITDNDGNTLLDYWMEWDEIIDPGGAGEAHYGYFWVNVSDNLDTDQTIYMYYGNDAVSTTSNGTNTFLMYEDWTSESIEAGTWDITDANGGVTYNAAGAQHGTIARFQGDAGATYKITSDYDTASPIALMLRMNMEEAGVGNTARVGSGHDGAFAFNLIDSTDSGEQFYVYDDDANQDSQAMTDAYVDAWITFQITRDGTNSKLYADTVLIETASCDPDIVTTNPVASLRVTDSEDDIYSDWFAARKFITTEPVFDSFGDQETAPPRSWNTVGGVDLIFPIGWHPVATFGYNAAFILAGLIMIPLSTIYMVRGGRKGASMDKLFYALIIFMIGLGLLIGGIMP